MAGPAGLHGRPAPRPRGRVHARARGGEPLDPGPPAADRLARGGRPDGAPAPRGDRLGPRGRGVMSHVGRPDDGTDVTSFFNLEFNVPLEADGASGAHGASPAMKIQDELMREVRASSRGINFNFSQLIRDNVEEALSGVKGANSVKLFGNDLATLEEAGQRVVERPADGPRDRERGPVPHRRPAQPGDPDRPRGLRPLRDQRGRRRGGRPGGHRRPGLPADGRGGEALRHRPPAAQALRDDPTVIARIPVDVPGGRRAGRGTHPALATGHDRARTSRAPPTSTARTTAATSRSSSASGAATWPRPSPRPSARSTTRRPGPGCRRATAIEWSGEFAQMQEANARLMCDGPAVDRPDHGPALHRVQLDQGRAAGHGQRGGRHDGGRLGLAADRHAVQHLGGGRLHLDLRRRRPERRAPDLVLQPDAGRGAAGPRGGRCAGRSCGSARWS